MIFVLLLLPLFVGVQGKKLCPDGIIYCDSSQLSLTAHEKEMLANLQTVRPRIQRDSK